MQIAAYPGLQPHGSVLSAASSAHRCSSLIGTSRRRPRRIMRMCGWTWRSKLSRPIPKLADASSRLIATRGTGATHGTSVRQDTDDIVGRSFRRVGGLGGRSSSRCDRRHLGLAAEAAGGCPCRVRGRYFAPRTERNLGVRPPPRLHWLWVFPASRSRHDIRGRLGSLLAAARPFIGQRPCRFATQLYRLDFSRMIQCGRSAAGYDPSPTCLSGFPGRLSGRRFPRPVSQPGGAIGANRRAGSSHLARG